MTARKTKTVTKTATASAARPRAAATTGKKRRSSMPKKQRRSAAPVDSAPSHEAIAHEAFLIWEASGRPEGQEMRHWLEAERRLAAPSAETRAA